MILFRTFDSCETNDAHGLARTFSVYVLRRCFPKKKNNEFRLTIRAVREPWKKMTIY